MVVRDLINIFLRLEMASKEESAEIVFADSKGSGSPFQITGVSLDEDGDVRLESDARLLNCSEVFDPDDEAGGCSHCSGVLSPRELAERLAQFDPSKTIYFVFIGEDGSPELYNVKDGGTHDRYSNDILMVSAAELTKTLMENTPDPSSILHFESGTINFTINSVYPDADGCFCLESNEIEELDIYPVSLILEELSAVVPETAVYFYDDEAAEYYGIYLSELRTDEHGDLWINVR